MLPIMVAENKHASRTGLQREYANCENGLLNDYDQILLASIWGCRALGIVKMLPSYRGLDLFPFKFLRKMGCF